MRIQGLTVDQALASLKASNEGLIPAEAARRLGEFGPDRVECMTCERLLRACAATTTNPSDGGF
jgi:hypothetical protein